MVCYSKKKKLIYIHVPKTGGLTIESILVKRYGFKYFTFENGRYDFLSDPMGKLGILRYILLYSKESKKYDLKSFKTFAFVRNPYERAISAIKYLKGLKNSRFPENAGTFITLSRVNVYYYMHFSLSQTDCLKDENGILNIDYIGKFENLMDDLKRILVDENGFNDSDFSRIHRNKSNVNISMDLDRIMEEVNIIHSDDFVNFGYEKYKIKNG